MLFLYPQTPLVLLIIPTARPNVLRGNVTRAINSRVIAALSKKVLVKITVTGPLIVVFIVRQNMYRN